MGVAVSSSRFKEGEFKSFPDAHPVSKFASIQNEFFDESGDWKYSTVLMYGLQEAPPLDYPSSNDFFFNQEDDYEKLFVPRYSRTFDFGPSQQEAIAMHCEMLTNNSLIAHAGEHYCILNELKSMDPISFPYANEEGQ